MHKQSVLCYQKLKEELLVPFNGSMNYLCCFAVRCRTILMFAVISGVMFMCVVNIDIEDFIS